jgi:ribosomal protein L11 methyltransferase
METTAWMEVCVRVDGELAEAVAEVLARFAPEGVVIESTEIAPDPTGEGQPRGSLRVCAYLPVNESLEDTRRQLEEALWHLGFIQSIPEPEYRRVEETDWAESWKEHFKPMLIGKRLAVIPPWLDPPDPERVTLRIDPGMAFGTGSHPSTQLSLELLEVWLEARRSGGAQQRTGSFEGDHLQDVTVIDIGTGSGILGIAALKLGVERVLGVDLDAQAVAVARQNAKANGVGERFELRVSSLSEIQAGNFSLSQASLVLANILAPVLVRMLQAGLADLVADGGYLVLGGIMQDQANEVITTAQEQGLQLAQRKELGDWVVLGLER